MGIHFINDLSAMYMIRHHYHSEKEKKDNGQTALSNYENFRAGLDL